MFIFFSAVFLSLICLFFKMRSESYMLRLFTCSCFHRCKGSITRQSVIIKLNIMEQAQGLRNGNNVISESQIRASDSETRSRNGRNIFPSSYLQPDIRATAVAFVFAYFFYCSNNWGIFNIESLLEELYLNEICTFKYGTLYGDCRHLQYIEC